MYTSRCSSVWIFCLTHFLKAGGTEKITSGNSDLIKHQQSRPLVTAIYDCHALLCMASSGTSQFWIESLNLVAYLGGKLKSPKSLLPFVTT